MRKKLVFLCIAALFAALRLTAAFIALVLTKWPATNSSGLSTDDLSLVVVYSAASFVFLTASAFLVWIGWRRR